MTGRLGVPEFSSLHERLEAALSDTSDVFVGHEADSQSYLSGLADSIRLNACEPFQVTATVMPPGFADLTVGSAISGLCVAHRDGYWLVYDPVRDRFYCFWGESPGNLGAHGVSGSPMYCWSA